jgi:hypothetical protein
MKWLRNLKSNRDQMNSRDNAIWLKEGWADQGWFRADRTRPDVQGLCCVIILMLSGECFINRDSFPTHAGIFITDYKLIWFIFFDEVIIRYISPLWNLCNRLDRTVSSLIHEYQMIARVNSRSIVGILRFGYLKILHYPIWFCIPTSP